MTRSIYSTPLHRSLIAATAGAALALASGAQAQVLSDGGPSASGLFDVVYNFPADEPGPALPNNIGDNTGTQLTQVNINPGAAYFYGQRSYFFSEVNISGAVPNPGTGANFIDSEVNLLDGGLLGGFAIIGATSTLNMTGGTAQNAMQINGVVNFSGGNAGQSNILNGTLNLSAGIFNHTITINSGGVLNQTGGELGTFTANATFDSGSTFNLSGGLTKGGVDIETGATLVMTGGELGSGGDIFGTANISGGNTVFMDIESGGIANISGGTIGNSTDVKTGGTANISGGSFGTDFDVDASGTVNLSGTSFLLGGGAIAGLNSIGDSVTITDRDVALTGFLADGSAFDFDLNSANGSGADYFDAGSTLTVTLVPEPSSLALLGLGGLGLIRRRR